MKTNTRVFHGNGFVVSTEEKDPWLLRVRHGRTEALLPVVGGVHPTGRWDGLAQPRLVSVKKRGSVQTWTFRAASTSWKKFETVWTLSPDSCRIRHQIEGEGRVDAVSFFEAVPGKRLPEPGNTLSLVRGQLPALRRFSIAAEYFHRNVFCPQPHAGRPPMRHADEEILLTSACTFGPVEYNTWFSPSLFCLGLLPAKGKGWFLGLGAPMGEHHYHTMRYQGGSGGWGVRVEFDGMVRVKGKWLSPEIEIRWADDVQRGLSEHVASGLNLGWFPPPSPALPREWRRPMYCGWGQQQVWSRTAENNGKLPFIDQLVSPAAEAMASEASYRKMVDLLEKADIPFGTLTIDAAWSALMCIPVTDSKKWKDLKGFIAEQQAKNRKVLLWLGCWNPVGLPDSMKMKHAEGLKDVLDSTAPEFRRELTKAIHEAISPEGLNADGFKLDFTGDMPRGAGYQPHRRIWGLELLRDYVGLIYRTMKAVKPSAVLQTHCANPLFADITDILRLNDIFEEYTDIRPMMKHRADMARIANPQWLIDTDNDPFISEEAWWDYMQFQPQIGVPSLYTITHMARSKEVVPHGRLRKLSGIWKAYLKKEKLA